MNNNNKKSTIQLNRSHAGAIGKNVSHSHHFPFVHTHLPQFVFWDRSDDFSIAIGFGLMDPVYWWPSKHLYECISVSAIVTQSHIYSTMRANN